MTQKNLIYKNQDQDIIFKALGGVSEVGATSYFIKWNGIKILIDAGKRMGGGSLKPEYDEIDQDIDVLFITHIHQDHVGSLMEYFDYFNIENIYSTKETRDTLRLVFKDTESILKKNIEKNEKELKYYTEKKINSLISKIKISDYNKKIDIKKKKDLSFMFINTSHLIGSTGIFLQDKGYNLFITSDFTESQKFFHPETNFEPVYNNNVDTIITETTYGRDEEGEEVLKENTLKRLEFFINKTFEKKDQNKGGNILIPAFAIGRTQEIILALLKLIKDNRIPYTTKIRVPFSRYFKNYAGKMSEKYYMKYKYILEEELEEQIPLDFDNFLETYLEPIDLRKETDDFFDRENQILIATPGMMGQYKKNIEPDKADIMAPIAKIALAILESKRHGIIFAGYQSPGTIGNKIQTSLFGNTFTCYNGEYTRNTPHIYKVTFPGHVSAKGIMSLIKKVNPQNLILAHGDLKSSGKISQAIRSRNVNVILPDIEEEIYLRDNGKKNFFSAHHKYCNLILALDKINIEYDNKKDLHILKNKKYENLEVIKVVKKIIKDEDKSLNHIQIIIPQNSSAMEFYNKIHFEISDLGISADLIYIDERCENKKNVFNELLELASETALIFKEKLRVYFITKNNLYSIPFNMIAQILNEKEYFINKKLEIKKALSWPIDINIKKIKNPKKIISENDLDEIYVENIGDNKKTYSDFYEIIDRIKYFKKGGKKSDRFADTLLERLPNQFPNYKDKNNMAFKKDFFDYNCKTLWGDIENIYDIKNGKAVEIILYIIKKLNEKIKNITFSNYVTEYKNHSFYGEVIGKEKDKIFYKMILENGIQYMTINLNHNIDVDLCIQSIGKNKR